MPFPFDIYPWANYQELNLAYFIARFQEIFRQWSDLYDTMTAWQAQTDADLEAWKDGVVNDIIAREAALRQELTAWKATTEQDISSWESATLAALTAWQTAAEAQFETIRQQAAASATAAAGSAADAATAKTAAETAQAAAEALMPHIEGDLKKLIGRIPTTWEQGALIYATGLPTPSNTVIRTTFTPVTGGDKITIYNGRSTQVVMHQYDQDNPTVQHLVAATEVARNSAVTVTLNSAAAFIRMQVAGTSITLGNDVLIVNSSSIILDYAQDNATKVISPSGGSYSNLLSHILTPGRYYISVSSTFTDKPVNAAAGGSCLIVYKFQSSLTGQIFVASTGTTYSRIITNSTFAPVSVTGADTYGWYNTDATLTKAGRAADAKSVGDMIASVSDSVTALDTRVSNLSEDVLSMTSYMYSLQRWRGKKIVTFGDSRTWYDGKTYMSTCKPDIAGTTCIGYQQQLRDLLQCTIINRGQSGITSPQIYQEILSYTFAGDEAAVILAGGVNDFIVGASAGALQPIGSTFDTDTSYGAWQAAVEYLQTNHPEIKIFMIVPAIAWKGSADTIFPYTTAEIKANVAELYNLPCLNLYKDAGISIINRDWFYADDPSATNHWRLHFNNDGNRWIGQIIAEFVNTH